ncbi:MAG: alpha-L-fucosidase [Ruminococcaceae bacterium]|nr:alpha-L-fucosidase [Oscillospiraceae bacterium]
MAYPRKKTPGDTAWFVRDRFGMFIHFGLYAVPARHEWLKCRERTPEAKYDQYFQHFDPDLMDARDWARQAKAAGMKYAVLTAKHHEGFCLFDSKHTEYKSTNTPCGRDLAREFVNAFRAEGIRVGFYYSLIDWHHPMFPIDKFHPRRGDANAEELDRGRDMTKYVQYMKDQITELLTNYGKIDILWLDFSYPADPNAPAWMQNGGGKGKEQWQSEELIAHVRSLAPDIILNDRAQIPQDIITPEQSTYDFWETPIENGEALTWETCQTFSGSWGYFRDETTWKTPTMLLELLVKTVSKGGNLIMNVGPTARGYLDSRAENALKVYADWMKYNARSIYGCTKAEWDLPLPGGVYLTQSEDGKRLYIHLFNYPYQELYFEGAFADRIEYAQLLKDGSEVPFRKTTLIGAAGEPQGEKVRFPLAGCFFEETVPVIEVFLKD